MSGALFNIEKNLLTSNVDTMIYKPYFGINFEFAV